MSFNVVLLEPQIPNNTGNIGRTCVATCSSLHLIHPLGFEITDSRVKRAGLDYWGDLDLHHHQDFNSFLNDIPEDAELYFLSVNGKKSLHDLVINKGDFLVFGREADGLPTEIKLKYENKLVKIPFPGKVRSFNLSNAVAMVLGEGLRQINLDL